MRPGETRGELLWASLGGYICWGASIMWGAREWKSSVWYSWVVEWDPCVVVWCSWVAKFDYSIGVDWAISLGETLGETRSASLGGYIWWGASIMWGSRLWGTSTLWPVEVCWAVFRSWLGELGSNGACWAINLGETLGETRSASLGGYICWGASIKWGWRLWGTSTLWPVEVCWAVFRSWLGELGSNGACWAINLGETLGETRSASLGGYICWGASIKWGWRLGCVDSFWPDASVLWVFTSCEAWVWKGDFSGAVEGLRSSSSTLEVSASVVRLVSWLWLWL